MGLIVVWAIARLRKAAVHEALGRCENGGQRRNEEGNALVCKLTPNVAGGLFFYQGAQIHRAIKLIGLCTGIAYEALGV
jgi:hypothetical protein